MKNHPRFRRLSEIECQKLHYPTLIDRNNYDGWRAKGGQDLGQRAAARVEHILAEHTPEPLPPDIQKRLREIVQRAKAGDRTF